MARGDVTNSNGKSSIACNINKLKIHLSIQHILRVNMYKRRIETIITNPLTSMPVNERVNLHLLRKNGQTLATLHIASAATY